MVDGGAPRSLSSVVGRRRRLPAAVRLVVAPALLALAAAVLQPTAAHAQAILVTDSSLSVNENDGTYDQFVWLSSQPTSDVTVQVASGDVSVAAVDPMTLMFTPSNYSDKQQVTYTGVDDDDTNNPNRQTTITFTASGGGFEGVSRITTIVLADDESEHYVLDEGTTRQWPHRWFVGQGCPAVMSFTSSDTSVLTVHPPTLTWNEGDSGTIKYLTISVLENDEFGDGLATISRSVHDPPCLPLTVSDLVITVRDNDSGMILSADRGAVEGGPDVQLTVTLCDAAPAGGTEVTLTARPDSTATLGDDYTLLRTVFTIAEGDRTGTATLHVIDDAVDDDDEVIYLFANSRNPELSSTGIDLYITDNDDGGGDGNDDDNQDEEGDDDEPVSVPALPLAGAAILAGLLALAGTRRTRR